MKRGLRWTAGILLIVGGCFGFLPILGFWMLPLGIACLAPDFPWAQRLLERCRRWIGKDQTPGPPPSSEGGGPADQEAKR